jgi:hypothetical protein
MSIKSLDDQQAFNAFLSAPATVTTDDDKFFAIRRTFTLRRDIIAQLDAFANGLGVHKWYIVNEALKAFLEKIKRDPSSIALAGELPPIDDRICPTHAPRSYAIERNVSQALNKLVCDNALFKGKVVERAVYLYIQARAVKSAAAP